MCAGVGVGVYVPCCARIVVSMCPQCHGFHVSMCVCMNSVCVRVCSVRVCVLTVRCVLCSSAAARCTLILQHIYIRSWVPLGTAMARFKWMVSVSGDTHHRRFIPPEVIQ